MHRLAPIVVLMTAWLVGGVLLEACERTEPPTPVPAFPTATVQPTMSPRSIVWLWGQSRPTAIDAVSGKELHRLGEVLGEPVSTRDKRLQYFVTWERVNQEFKLYLERLDMLHAESSPRIFVATFPVKEGDLYENALATTLLSADEKTVFVALTDNLANGWQTNLYKLNLATAQVSAPALVFDSPVEWGPNVNLALTPDEREILLTRAVGKTEARGRVYTTHVASVDARTFQVTGEFALPGAIQADIVWPDIKVSPSGDAFYVVESIWRDSGAYELRFSSFERETGQPILSHTNRRDTIETGCDSRFHFVQDTNMLWNWCMEFVQFLDPATGRIETKVPLTPAKGNSSFADFALSADGTTLYTVFPIPREIVVLDLATQKIQRRTIMPEQARAPNPFAEFAELFVSTANAKSLVRPLLALSPDETWLAFVDVRDFDTLDGIWTVETATLKPLGHWHRNQNITGVRASADGQSLYLLNRLANKLQILEPKTGEVTHAVSIPLAVSSGFVTDTGR